MFVWWWWGNGGWHCAYKFRGLNGTEVSSPVELKLRVSICELLGMKLGSCEAQSMLLSKEPSLQPPWFTFGSDEEGKWAELKQAMETILPQTSLQTLLLSTFPKLWGASAPGNAVRSKLCAGICKLGLVSLHSRSEWARWRWRPWLGKPGISNSMHVLWHAGLGCPGLGNIQRTGPYWPGIGYVWHAGLGYTS